MEKEKDGLVKKIENNIRFAITISILFLAIFSEARLEGSILIVAYLLCHIVFEIREISFSVRHLKWIKNTLFVGIGSYIAPLVVVGLSTQNTVFEAWEVFTLMGSLVISMHIILIAPVSILVMMCFLSDIKWINIKENLGFKRKSEGMSGSL